MRDLNHGIAVLTLSLTVRGCTKIKVMFIYIRHAMAGGSYNYLLKKVILCKKKIEVLFLHQRLSMLCFLVHRFEDGI
jgi:hypothetical protein